MTLLSQRLKGGVIALGLAPMLLSQASANELVIVGWGGSYQEAQREAYFEPFEKASGIKVHEDTYDGGVGALRARVESGTAQWDVVDVEDADLAVGCEEGLFETIDWSKVRAEEDFIPEAVSECGVGTIIYSFVFAYDGARVQGTPQSWSDFFDVTKYPGKRSLRKGPKGNLELALLADGVPSDEIYSTLATSEGVKRAFAKLGTLGDNLIWWEAGAQPVQLLASGEVVFTSSYNGRITSAAQSEKRDFHIVWNQQLYDTDSWVILKGSTKLDQAYDFLKFASDPQNQKNLPNLIAYGVTTKEATAQIDPEVLKNIPSNPENLAKGLKVNTEFWLDNLDRLTEQFNTWVAK